MLSDVVVNRLAQAAGQLWRERSGFAGTVLMRRVHRFEETVRDGAWTELRARLRALADRLPGLGWAG